MRAFDACMGDAQYRTDDTWRMTGNTDITLRRRRFRILPNGPTNRSRQEICEDFKGRTSSHPMSRSRITKQPKPPQPIVWWHIALGFATILIGVAAVYLAANWIHSIPSKYETSTGKILEIRKVVDHTRDTLYGGKISYRAEAHVQYLADGRLQDRWLHRSDDLTQEGLLLKLASHPTESLVYWSPNHPENARCSFK